MVFLLRVAFLAAAAYGIYLLLRWYDRRQKEQEKTKEWNQKIDKWDQDRKIRQNQKEIDRLRQELDQKSKGK